MWTDARTVNVVAEAATEQTTCKVMVTALNFFVGRFQGKALTTGGAESGEGSENDEESEYQNLLHTSKFNANKKQ